MSEELVKKLEHLHERSWGHVTMTAKFYEGAIENESMSEEEKEYFRGCHTSAVSHHQIVDTLVYDIIELASND